jgi:hypothetical protein
LSRRSPTGLELGEWRAWYRRYVRVGRSKFVELDTRTFKTQSEATTFFREMLSRYEPGNRVNDEDSLDLAALLERHPNYVTKIGCGVDHFGVEKTQHGTKCFRVVRVDGSNTDFSYPKCIAGRSPSRKQEVSAAFRQVVRFDLYRARDAFFAEHSDAEGCVTCAESGQRLERVQAHMDHRPPMTFEVIVTTFLAHQGLSPESVDVTTGQDNQVSPEITDKSLCEAFRSYHSRVARLDFVKSTINLAQSSPNRLKTGRVILNA